MTFRDNLKYTKTTNGSALKRHRDHRHHRFRAGELGDVVFVELPARGKKIKKGRKLRYGGSRKAVSDLYSPVSGESLT